ncbi:MAG: hypothetical protein ABJC26_18725 [Gemmatimonadaceae bacterium]
MIVLQSEMFIVDTLPDDFANVVSTVARAAEPWRSLYAGSNVVSTSVLFVHLSALLVSGGLAVSADRSVIQSKQLSDSLRASRLLQLGETHRPVVIALSISFISGVLLLLADVEAFVGMRPFWIKMALIFLLVINASFMLRQERRLRAVDFVDSTPPPPVCSTIWTRLRFHAWASLSLWFAIVLAGTAMTSA